MLILSGLRKGGASETDTPLLCNRLYFNILHFTLEIGSGAETAAAAAAGFAGGGGGVTKEVRSGEIGFSGPVRKNNFIRAAWSPPRARCRGQNLRSRNPKMLDKLSGECHSRQANHF